jgi:hypothetical protein
MGATVHALPNGGLTVADVNGLHEALHRLELVVAGLAGEVKAMSESRKTDYDHLIERIGEVNHKRRSTDAALEKAIDLLREYPKPKHIEDLQADVESLMAWRQKMIGIALGIGAGSGLLSGGIVAALARAAGG